MPKMKFASVFGSNFLFSVESDIFFSLSNSDSAITVCPLVKMCLDHPPVLYVELASMQVRSLMLEILNSRYIKAVVTVPAATDG